MLFHCVIKFSGIVAKSGFLTLDMSVDRTCVKISHNMKAPQNMVTFSKDITEIPGGL